jgi:hypothetical protein
LTSCPSCIAGLNLGATKIKKTIKIAHILEWLANLQD